MNTNPPVDDGPGPHRKRTNQGSVAAEPCDGPNRPQDLSDMRIIDEIGLLAHRLSVGTLELLVLVGEADSRGIWERSGALSCAAWLARMCEIEMSTARTQVRVARAMRTYQPLQEAMSGGEISYAKARILVPHLTADNAEALVDLAGRTPVGSLGAAIAGWSNRNEDPDVIRDRQHQARSVSWRIEPDGMVTITARLPPQMAGIICAVIDHHVTTRPSVSEACAMERADAPVGARRDADQRQEHDAPTGVHPARPSLRQQRADALLALATDGGASVETEVVVHVRGEGNALEDGTPLSDHAVGSLLPDSFVSLLIHDCERRPIDASPRRRFPTRRQRRVIDELYHECARDGCSATVFLQYDHEEPYAQGGLTVVDNLQKLCGPHNRVKHQEGR